MENWVSPNTITGPPAEGNNYFERTDIEIEFWRRVKSGSHILFLAPRRVGKTSVMKHIATAPAEGYVCFYENIQSVKDKADLFKRIFEMILKCTSKGEKAINWLSKVSKQFGIKELSLTGGVKFEKQDIDFANELFGLLNSMAEIDEHVVLFLDEFPEVINRLRKAGRQEEAIEILDLLRELRQTGQFKNFTMVIAGSIGLEYVVKKIDRPKHINDLHPIRVGELDTNEAEKLIMQVTKGATIQYDDTTLKMLLDKLSYKLPYYIQLMIDEVDVIAKKKGISKVTKEMVDEAFDNIVRYNRNLEDWYSRLADTYDGEFKFVNEVLITCAKDGMLNIQQIANIAQPYGLEAECVSLMDDLCNDGYLIEDNNHVYSFVSPVLHAYWKRKFGIL